MEIKKKLNTPSGNIHDIKYLYNVIAGLKRKGGQLEAHRESLEYFRSMINDYNDAKASRYGLSFKPREVNIKVVKHAVAEVKNLKLIRKENGYWVLTNEGEKVASLIERKDSNELKKFFAKLMLENYNIFEHFLSCLKKLADGEGIPIPSITAEVFDKCDGEPRKIAENYVSIINKNCSNLIAKPKRLYDLLENANVGLMEKRTDKINKLQAIIEKYVVSEAFKPNIKSRRAYDFVRSRTTFLELTNYATFDFGGFQAEVTYLISDFEPAFSPSTKRVDFSGGNMYINCPTFEEIRESLKNSITKAYNTHKDEFGYTKIADVRDMGCRELKISDGLFDKYLKRLYKEELHWVSLTYSGWEDKVTEKRLPIIFEKPIREFFTLLKVNSGR